MSRKISRLFIVGETATGKSSLAMRIAQRYNGEIICADSVTVYKGFNIGSAKPTGAEAQKIPHHMLDIVEANQNYSVALFKEQATTEVSRIVAAGKLPIIVGGSGLYVDSLLHEYDFSEVGEAENRQYLQGLTLVELQDKVRRVILDDESLDQLDWNNPRRLIRAIEKRGVSQTVKRRQSASDLVIGLRHASAAARRQAIEQRVERMFKIGLRKELDKLRKLYDWDSEPMKSIGYREFKNYFAEKHSMSKVKREIVRSTLKLAKHQRTWFKRNQTTTWFTSPDQAFKAVDALMNTNESQNDL